MGEHRHRNREVEATVQVSAKTQLCSGMTRQWTVALRPIGEVWNVLEFA